MSDMKDIQLPHKLTNDYKININIEDISKHIDKLGAINHQSTGKLSIELLNNLYYRC